MIQLLFMFREILLVSGKSEVVEVCKKSINLTFEGTPGEECKWLHFRKGQDQPCCCYPLSRGGLEQACKNFTNSPEFKSKANASQVPEINSFKKNCTIIIKNPSSQDFGRYEGYMPHKKLTISASIDYQDICVHTYHLSADNTYNLSAYWFLFLFIFAAVVPFIVTLIKWKCSHCCRRS